MLALGLCPLASFLCSHSGSSLSVLTVEWTAELELESPESGLERLTPGPELFAPGRKASEGVGTASEALQNISNIYKAQRGSRFPPEIAEFDMWLTYGGNCLDSRDKRFTL
jgi:hypothetical protein